MARGTVTFTDLLILFVMANVASAAVPGVLPNSWLEGDDSAYVSYSMEESGAVKIQFAANRPSSSVPPSRPAGELFAGVGVSSGAFVGDYVASGVEGVQFSVMGDGHTPSGAMLILRSASGRDWFYKPLKISSNAGEWTINNVRFTLDSGWARNDLPGTDKEANFLEDIRNVTSIGMAFAPGGTEAQYYVVANFVLYGADGVLSGPAELTPLEKALLDMFQVDDVSKLNDSQKIQDSDKDGMTDVDEILSEYDVQYANSTFKSDVETPEGDSRITIKWPCVKGRNYTVLRTKNIMDPFVNLPDGKGKDMIATETGYMRYVDDDATDAGPFFYRITKK